MKRLQLTLLAAMVACVAAPAAAQSGRLQGVVRDADGRGIQGAVVRAINPDALRGDLTSTTDDRGRFAMLGLQVGQGWRLVIEAPGFHSGEAAVQVRSTVGRPLEFVLSRDPGPPPGALVTDIQEQIAAAHALRVDGRLDEAIAAYELIRARNARLTAIGLVLGAAYREKADLESDSTTRRELLERARAAYEAVLQGDAGEDLARTEMAAVTADLEQLAR